MGQFTIQQTFELALQQHRSGRLPEAEQLYRQILAQQPEHIDAMNNLAVIANETGRNDLALDLIRRVISLRPGDAGAHNNLGNALKKAGRLDDAIAAYRHSIALDPDTAGVHNNLGSVLKGKGQLDEAIAAFRQAIDLNPKFADAHRNLGNALKETNQLDGAIAAYRQAVALNPNLPEAQNNLGNALNDKGQLDQAIAAFRQAIAINPNLPEAHNNLGNALKSEGQLNEAIAAYRQAIALRPKFAGAHFNLGNALKDKAHFDDAIAAFRQAIALQPEFPTAHYNLALALLARGDFQPGWEEYEWRWKWKDFPFSVRNFVQPQWNGEPLDNRTILLHAEQGLGDAIQFIRYVPMVAHRGGKIIIECHDQLQRLFQPMAERFQIMTLGQPLPAFDFHCPLLSLPRVFQTDLASIPNTVPYLSAEPALVDAWSKKLGPPDGQLKIGLAWAGNPQYSADGTRSLDLHQLAPLAAIQGVKFYSLQKGQAAEQAKNPPPGLELVDLGPDLNDFADTAAVMSLLDLIIAADTSVPHLAGAMAKPVWVMLRSVPDFRWLLERDDSPWYPTMRLFRQKRSGDWDSAIASVVDELSVRIKNRA
jgi:tetratricopeptide (TPR) repeat protein